MNKNVACATGTLLACLTMNAMAADVYQLVSLRDVSVQPVQSKGEWPVSQEGSGTDSGWHYLRRKYGAGGVQAGAVKSWQSFLGKFDFAERTIHIRNECPLRSSLWWNGSFPVKRAGAC